jgi:tRNA (uracil-5-)-methyltransferase TRM9
LRLGDEDGGSRGPGKALIYVWALEQKDSRRGWDEGGEQDVMVPWVMKTGSGQKKGKGKKGKRKEGEENQAAEPEQQEVKRQPEEKTFLRYYHLYRKGELEHDIDEAGGIVVESGYEKDNWWAIAIPKNS